MKSTKYIIKTIQDITNTVTEDNLDNFLIDFKSWLLIAIKFKDKNLKILENIVKFDNSKFKWIDDNKHNAVINIKTKKI